MDLQAFFESLLGQLITAAVIAAILAVIYFSGAKRNKNHASVIAVSAVLIALAFVLNNFAPHFSLPYGGSVTLFSMFVLYFVGYCYGPRVGILAGIAFGLMNLLINPAAYYPVQIILDYFLAFGMIGAGSILRKKKNGIITGYLLGVFGRFICSFLSGVIFFAMYAPAGYTAVTWSIVYNGRYMGIEAALTVVVLLIKPVRAALEKLAKKYGA
jgi:thiamine transporter